MNFAYRLPAHETIGTEAFHRFGLRDAALWGTAFVVVLAAQVVGAVALSNWRNTPEIPGAPPPAIMIELSEISVAPQVEDIAAEQGELALEQDAATPAEATPAEAVPEEVVEPVETEPVLDPIEPEVLETAEAVLPEPLPEPVVEPVEEPPPEPLEPVELEAPLEPEVEPIEPPPEVEPLEEVIPDLIETEIAEVVVPLPRQLSTTLEEKRREFAEAEQRKKDVQEKKQREAKQKQQKKQKEEAARKAQAASRQTAPQSVEAEASDKVAAKETASTTKKTPRVSPQKWQSQVIAHLNRMKKYPADARKRREEGVPRLQFTIDRAGRVLSARIIRSSGFPALDQAALDMINRASPVPAPPDTIPDSRITLTVPVNFNLK
jgi:protein TonB